MVFNWREWDIFLYPVVWSYMKVDSEWIKPNCSVLQGASHYLQSLDGDDNGGDDDNDNDVGRGW